MNVAFLAPTPPTMTNVTPATAPQANGVRVLIVEDHAMFAEALAQALRSESDLSVVGIAGGLAAARNFLRQQAVDVVLMDHGLPDGDGLVGARQIRREHPRTQVILVTATDDRQLVADALGAGCAGFLSKQESLVHLPGAIRNAIVGTRSLSPEMATRLLEVPKRPALHDDLTERELDILRLLAHGWSNEQIAGHLFLSGSTLRNHISRVNSKLGASSRLAAVSKALRTGVIRLDPQLAPPDDGG